ncbi:hypothetical protein V2O64_14135 [Verrucomicrobiaceae bacterium 227]
MLRFIFLFILTLTSVRGELITRAYYIGKDQLSHWNTRNQKVLEANKDEKTPDPSPLKSAPFKSPHFNPKDVLYDFKSFKALLTGIQELPTHAIYNQSTGRLVVQGDHLSHNYFKSITIATCRELPTTLAVQIEILQDGNLFPTTTLEAKPGQETKVTLSDENYELAITWEAYSDARDSILEVRFTIEGHANNQRLKCQTGITTLPGSPEIIALGKSSPNQPPLQLRLTHHILLPGGLSTLESVLDEHGNPTDLPHLRVGQSSTLQEGIIDPKTGKILRSYSVPPTFLDFMGSTLSGDLDRDPFAETDENKPSTPVFSNLTQWDARIPVAPLARMEDCKWLLRNSGVDLDDNDYAIFHEDSSTLYVLGNKTAQELVEGIVRHTDSSPPRIIETNFQLIETAAKPTLESLKNKPTLLAQATTIVLPGQSSTLTLGPMHLNLEAQIDSNDSLVEARFLFQLAEGKEEPSFYLKSGMLFESGIPQIIQSTFTEGNWQSLIMTATIQSPWERVPLKK